MKYAFVKDHCSAHGIRQLCSALDVSTSGYYDWCNRAKSPRVLENQRLLTLIKCHHASSNETYGSPRIHKDLVAEGEVVNIKRVARLMREADVVPKAARRFVITTNSKSNEPPAPDLLQRQFLTDGPNQAWVCDTTFIRTREGWLYLAIVLELFSRQIIGWSMGSRNNKTLVIDAITMAVWRRKRPQGVIVHSDQGSTYRSKDHRKYLEANQLLCSMSRKGECLDNAVAESFFGTLKTEHVDYQDYRSRDEARRSIFEYIELFYNVRRRHSTIGYVSPVEFELNASD